MDISSTVMQSWKQNALYMSEDRLGEMPDVIVVWSNEVQEY